MVNQYFMGMLKLTEDEKALDCIRPTPSTSRFSLNKVQL